MGCWGWPHTPTGTAGPGSVCPPRSWPCPPVPVSACCLPTGLSRSPSQGARKAAVLPSSTGDRPGDGQAGALGGFPSACEAGARALEEGRAGGSGRAAERPRPLHAPLGLAPGVSISLVQGWGSAPPPLPAHRTPRGPRASTEARPSEDRIASPRCAVGSRRD